jgi:LacI family transcriptional regulator, galactose operon repressor
MNGKSRVTLYDIARKTGTSASTVSRVLNDSVLVGDETRKRILIAAADAGYQKRRIRRQQARKILNVALVIPHYKERANHLFYDVADLVAGLEAGFADVRARILVTLSNTSDRLFQHKKLVDLDGCIFAFTVPQASVRTVLAERNVPWVVLNRISKEFNFVSVDNKAGMIELVRHAYSRWGRDMRSCYIGFSPVKAVSDQRKQGFRMGLSEVGLNPSDALEWDLATIEDLSSERIRDLRSSGVNAFFCFNDTLAVYFYQLATLLGVAIPRQASLSGFDYSPVRNLLVKPLDTIVLSVADLGMEVGTWLKRYVIDKTEQPIHLLVKGRYVPGETIRSEG